MQPYTFLEDIAVADVAFEAYGEDLAELFANCGLATTAVMVDLKTLEEKKKRKISLLGDDLERLLFDFLCELIYLKDTASFLSKRFSVSLNKSVHKYNLRVECFGDKFDYKKHAMGNDVKAVTMHLFKIEKIKKGYKATVILDI
ncbi:archease [Candidatus Woesearchaeota archaeon]|nr:archease [Candidatus Woesearchaeota archaeon]